MDTISKTKGRMTSIERDYKKSQGKDLFVKGFSIPNISDIIGVGVKTLSGWRDDCFWQDEKDLNSLKPSVIRNMTLRCALAIQKGEPLPYKADDISKITASFERISDYKKIAVYTMESIDGFATYMTVLAGKNIGKKREEVLDMLQKSRVYMDQYVNELLQND